jgi:acetyl esterase/lipase
LGSHLAKKVSLVIGVLLSTVAIEALEAQEAIVSVRPQIEKFRSWKIGPRLLPISPGISDALRQVLLNTPAPDVDAARTVYPQGVEEWREEARARDAQAALAARALAEALSVGVKRATIAGVPVFWITPPEVDPRHDKQLFVHVHGGAYVLNGGEAATTEAVLHAALTGMRVISIDYRMAPDHPAPAAIDDVVAVWKELLQKHRSSTLALGGTSAGGGLAMASVHRFKELDLDLPGALFVGTPASDVGYAGDTKYINEGIDRSLVSWEGGVAEAISLYVGDFAYDHPYVSPIYGDFSGFPPTYVIAGTRDLMLSDAVRAHRKLRAAGVEADLHVYEGHSHGDYLVLWNEPDGREHFRELKAFLLKHLEM